jgi:hypothetical protein
MAGNTGPKGVSDTASLIEKLPPAIQKALAANLAKGGGGGGSTSTAGGPTSNVTVNKYSESAATPNINSIWRNTVGRDATAKEVSAITAAINAAMKANPDKVASSGGANSMTSRTAGADMNTVIQQQALANPEAAPYQAATTYYDSLLQILKGPLGGGY